ncbi:hypothetical protein VHUM_03084 [Vanrija humicola]|uniref:Uncharacterized protein n=1 Tax=Vanrija humicola TaxID=5417 RepID=A0A7D8Z291_VANHU|nr:hypothetical protein VHUM_03084 [Vanrija humicola]
MAHRRRARQAPRHDSRRPRARPVVPAVAGHGVRRRLPAVLLLPERLCRHHLPARHAARVPDLGVPRRAPAVLAAVAARVRARAVVARVRPICVFQRLVLAVRRALCVRGPRARRLRQPHPGAGDRAVLRAYRDPVRALPLEPGAAQAHHQPREQAYCRDEPRKARAGQEGSLGVRSGDIYHIKLCSRSAHAAHGLYRGAWCSGGRRMSLAVLCAMTLDPPLSSDETSAGWLVGGCVGIDAETQHIQMDRLT